jgi:hypothetical protein
VLHNTLLVNDEQTTQCNAVLWCHRTRQTGRGAQSAATHHTRTTLVVAAGSLVVA